VQTPEYRISNRNQLDDTPLAAGLDANGAPIPTLLGNLASATRVGVQSVYNQSNIQPVYDIYGSVQDLDLGRAEKAIGTLVKEVEPKLKPGNYIVVRGQIDSMRSAVSNLTIWAHLRRRLRLHADGRQLSELY
jgi:hypothetical protein